MSVHNRDCSYEREQHWENNGVTSRETLTAQDAFLLTEDIMLSSCFVRLLQRITTRGPVREGAGQTDYH